MDASNNKFLKVKRGVVLNERIEPVIMGLEKYFKDANLISYVTSGERSSQDQLNTIKKYCIRYGIEKEFPEIINAEVLGKIEVDGNKYFTWQQAWSRLLNIGVIINPPVPAIVLFDYIRNGVNKKNEIIGYSPHYYGNAFDIGGNSDGVENEKSVVDKALKDKLPGLKGYLVERANNCLHVDVYTVLIDKPFNI